MELKDYEGIIKLGTEVANELGFTADLFDGYLWKTNNRITISLIVSLKENEGNLKALMDRIEELGYELAIPSPSPRMEQILSKRGFHEVIEDHEPVGPVPYWRNYE